MIKNSVLVVVDVESTCWDTPAGQHDHTQVSEIIEIGVALLHLRTLKVINQLDFYIQPRLSKVTDYCTELTGITQAKLDKEGVHLHTAYKALRAVGTKDLGWASFGDYDRKMISATDTPQVKNPFSNQHLNIKMHFNATYQIRPDLSSVGLAEALEYLGMPFEGRQHNGMDDAINGALLYAELLRRTRRPI